MTFTSIILQRQSKLYAPVCAVLLFLTLGCAKRISMPEEVDIFHENKTIPKEIAKEAKIALSYYPELEKVSIDFKFKKKIKKSFMQAQPHFLNIFSGKNNRSYNIYISTKVNIEGKSFSVEDIPSDVLIGWLGHELGHIVDYREKTAFGLIIFGLRYITSQNFIKEAERAADTYAVGHGMGDYILKTKNFILNNTDLSEAYKNRIKRLYLSPEEIVVLVNEKEEEMKKDLEAEENK